MQQFEEAFNIADSIMKYLRNELSESEKIRLDEWLSESPDNRDLFNRLQDEYFMLRQQQSLKSFDAEAALKKIKENINQESTVVSIKKNRNKWWMAAAAILVVAASLTYIFILKQNNAGEASSQLVKSTTPAKDDVQPGSNKAILTLADGSTIELDAVNNGMLAKQGNMKVIKLSGDKLAYEKADGSIKDIQYNTISTPRGGQFQLVLADGSHVWLNAASSITFPTSFAGDKREVSISGEAYFEVAHHAGKPFRVSANNVIVQVLGTHFNMSAYANEGNISTTLIEGAVKVIDGKASAVIKPGEQAIVKNSSEQISVLKDVNLESIIAWKNGKFNFQEEDIHSIMRKLERWYDIKVTIQQDVTKEKFVGVISRDVQLSQILRMLEKTGVVGFSVVGKTVIVK